MYVLIKKNIPGGNTAPEQICISVVRLYFSMFFSTPEWRRYIADSLRITETGADTLVDGFGSKFLDGMLEGITNFNAKIDARED